MFTDKTRSDGLPFVACGFLRLVDPHPDPPYGSFM